MQSAFFPVSPSRKSSRASLKNYETQRTSNNLSLSQVTAEVKPDVARSKKVILRQGNNMEDIRQQIINKTESQEHRCQSPGCKTSQSSKMLASSTTKSNKSKFASQLLDTNEVEQSNSMANSQSYTYQLQNNQNVQKSAYNQKALEVQEMCMNALKEQNIDKNRKVKYVLFQVFE
ncbi:Hypothetical_protein [Hexamita inflata]|uniref:Hypothetical_protein n=1 Tax=Hexamita inflata TaxID=28002 RepID=A0AA86U7M7_9EUKA|nr:Hypothetical protein HINF_LOCUS29866 [Hexamita inflata]